MDLERALEQFGLTSFRPGQREVIAQIVAGDDCLCVMPTGGGKSLCFQLPTLLRPGLTIVVSPLIALMKDQVDTLARRGISATLINSTLTNGEQHDRLIEMTAGKFAMVYVAPERLRNQRFLEAIRATPIQLLAVDEAHCISEWGHDFRPDYARIGQFRQALGGVQTVALTATATPRVRQDICAILGLRNPKQFVTGFSRTNLHLGSLYCTGDRDKDKALIEFLQTKPGAGIIYAATRKRCESLVETLSEKVKLSIGAYHAGLTLDQRKFVQEQFMSGKLEAIVATNAFGMGIDKADLRFVVHYNIPGSIEAYYQEAGRAGRDGLPSQCVVLYSPHDRYIQEFFIENAHPPRELIAKVYELISGLTDDPIEKTAQEMRDLLEVPQAAEAIGTALQILAKTGVIERLEVSGGLAMFRIVSSLPTMVDMLPKEAEVRRKVLRAVEKAVGDRRDEPVYVHPRWLMQQTDMDRESLGRNLSELRKLPGFEYVPPFRGRAIHFRKRNVPFEQLPIDYAALEARKQADFEKLEQVVAFAQSKRCRQLSILQYFGDPDAKPCGICDRCQGKAGWPTMAAWVSKSTPVADEKSSAPSVTSSPPSMVVASTLPPIDTALAGPRLRAILDAIARHRGLFGKGLISDFLGGGKTEKVERLRLSKIQGYGLLRGTRKKTIEACLEAMLASDLLESKMPTARRPTLAVSPIGWEVVQGKRPIPPAVLEQLSKLEFDPSSQSSTLPSQTHPASVATKHPSPPDSSKVVPAPHGPVAAEGDWNWTLRLAQDAYQLTEIAAIRRMTIDQVLDDLSRAASLGQTIPMQQLLDPNTVALLQNAHRDPVANENHPFFVQRPSLWKLAQATRG